MTFIPTEKPRWKPSPEEWRLLVITFVGGLASIVVGAGLIGAALVLGRGAAAQATTSFYWWWLGAATLVAWGGLAAFAWASTRGINRSMMIVVAALSGLFASLLTLTWIGIAAGVH